MGKITITYPKQITTTSSKCPQYCVILLTQWDKDVYNQAIRTANKAHLLNANQPPNNEVHPVQLKPITPA